MLGASPLKAEECMLLKINTLRLKMKSLLKGGSLVRVPTYLTHQITCVGVVIWWPANFSVCSDVSATYAELFATETASQRPLRLP